MKTMTVSMWSAGLKTFIFPAGSIHAGFSREKIAERKPPPIAGTGLRIRFKVRKEEPSSDLISVRVFEALGLDTTSLVQAREEYKRIQEQKRREQKEKEAEERRVQEEQHQRLLNEQKEKFLDGERITGEMFLEITGRDGFDIHIRTKGTFNRHVRGIDRNGTVSFRKIKGCRTPDFTGCHKAVSAYLAFITEKEGK